MIVAAGGGALIIIWIALYFIPTIVAFARGMPNKGTICVINVFLGWTFIGWVVALAWACKAKVPVVRDLNVNVNSGGQVRGPKSMADIVCQNGHVLGGGERYCPQCGAPVHD